MAISISQVIEITNVPTIPLYSPHGYVITKDGTTYTLLHRSTNG
jgi:hypothetical protein